MDDHVVISPELTIHDNIVLRNLIDDIKRYKDEASSKSDSDEGYASRESVDDASLSEESWGVSAPRDASDLDKLKALNDPTSKDFEPTVIASHDLRDFPAKLPRFVHQHVVLPYVAWARTMVRHDTDVLMLTQLMLYFATSVPSAIWLFRNFTYLHGVLHVAMQIWYVGTYTLMMHQHIHMNGILAKRPLLQLVDAIFPYITDPLMGHTWNTYYYHHVKHHHVEGNGPDDLSSTIRYQRDDVFHFLHYLGRFYFLIWLDLPRYFLRKGRSKTALMAGFWELFSYASIYAMFRLNSKAATFAFLIPLSLMRLGLMVGNWGQHAFVDADDPTSDFRSSVTLVDVASNRFCYNDGYHTSHHLNPRRHWRDHPVSFLQQKETYIREKALVFHDIDYFMMTVTLLRKDYLRLAQCLVPIGDQINMTIEERATMLRRHTRRFSEDEIRRHFGGGAKSK